MKPSSSIGRHVRCEHSQHIQRRNTVSAAQINMVIDGWMENLNVTSVS